MHHTYAILSEHDHRIYVGMTRDPFKRLNDHNSGRVRSTRPYRPWKLVYIEHYESRIEAREREKYLKSGVGKEFLKCTIKNEPR